MRNKRVLIPVIVALAAAALACTCGPLANLTGQVENVMETTGDLQVTLNAAATEMAQIAPTVEAGLTLMPEVEIPTVVIPTVSQPDEPARGGVPSCESPAVGIEIGQSYDEQMQSTTQGYPANCMYYCADVPAGQGQFNIEISNFSEDLDLYVGFGSLATVQGEQVVEGETYYWKSNEGGTVPERVSISSPSPGLYYIEVCSYNAMATPFRLSTSAR